MTTMPPERQPSDNHEVITVRGAHVNNLKGVDIDIPKRRMTVFTGVSGSGKSSLVFDTIAAESQRLINETYSSFVQTFMPTLARPEVDTLKGITAAIIVSQERMTANARSTVGTVTDVGALLRILFSRLSDPYVGSPQAFSFNVPTVSGKGAVIVNKKGGKPETKSFEITGGMCPTCEGRGKAAAIDESFVVDKTKSLNDGAILAPNFSVGSWAWKFYGESDKLDPDKPLKDYTKAEWDWFWHQEPVKGTFFGMNTTYMGLLPKVRQAFVDKAAEAKQAHIRAYAEKIATFTDCPDCGGTRLATAARTAKVAGHTLPEVSAMQITDLLEWVRTISDPAVAPLVKNLGEMLEGFVDIGLGYLSIDRESGSLSGGRSGCRAWPPWPSCLSTAPTRTRERSCRGCSSVRSPSCHSCIAGCPSSVPSSSAGFPCSRSRSGWRLSPDSACSSSSRWPPGAWARRPTGSSAWAWPPCSELACGPSPAASRPTSPSRSPSSSCRSSPASPGTIGTVPSTVPSTRRASCSVCGTRPSRRPSRPSGCGSRGSCTT